MGPRAPRPHPRQHGAPRRLARCKTGINRCVPPLAVTSAIAWLFPAAFFLLGLAMVLITLRVRMRPIARIPWEHIVSVSSRDPT